MDVYIDVLFLINFCVNYVILLVANKFLQIKSKKYRLVIGAMLGALYVIILVVFPQIKLSTVIGKILFSVLIVMVSFYPNNVMNFFKAIAAFYVSTFMFAGATFYLVHLNAKENFIRNGIMYISYDPKLTMLISSICLLGIILKVFWNIFQKSISSEKLLVPVTVVFEKKSAKVFALIDTGNSLFDPITNSPVVIVEFNAIRSILPSEVKKMFEYSNEIDLTYITGIANNTNWFSRFRIIPFSSLGKDNGILMGFKPDYLEIGKSQHVKNIKNVVVGICNKALCKDRSYEALLSPDLV